MTRLLDFSIRRWARCAIRTMKLGAAGGPGRALSVGLHLVLGSILLAMPASPHPVLLVQPDGAAITLHIRGDEYLHWFEDLNGFTVTRDGASYVYARLDAAGRLVPTAHLVGRADPRMLGLAPGLRPGAEVRRQARSSVLVEARRPPQAASVTPQGAVQNLVVLCRFADHALGVHTRPPADYEILFNSVNGHWPQAPTGSVRDCFRENSYGQLTLVSTVAPWITLPHDEAFYAAGSSGLGGAYPANPQGMVEDALNAVDAVVDFGDFDTNNDGYIDAISIVHSGYGAETGGGNGNWIWSHRWSLWALPGGEWVSSDTNALGVPVKVFDYHTEPALWGTSGNDLLRIGVVVHETGHFFGLPDLYDTNDGGTGIGSYCMMANSWGFDGSQHHPPHLSAWCKAELGWVTPLPIELSGQYAAPRVEVSPTVFRIDQGYPPGEYLLIENRQPVGFDDQMPQGGLAIWHIDEDKCCNTDEGYPGQPGWPQNNDHYRVALLQADGNYDLEHGYNRGDAGDVFHAGGATSLNATTVPDTHAYQDGEVFATHHAISAIGPAAPTMTFSYSRSQPLCGNGSVDAGEQCDDGAPIAGDGCDAFCQFEGPGHDNCVNAQPVCNGTVSGSTSSMNSDGAALCGSSAASPDVWYRYNPISGGSMVIDTCGSSFDTVVSVHAACPQAGLAQLACNDDHDLCGPQSGLSRISLPVTGGSQYLIRVSGSEGASGNFVLHLAGPPCAAPVCANGVVEPGEDCDPPDGVECSSTCQSCAELPPHGDFDGDGTVDVEDVLCVLDGFAGSTAICPAEAADLAPCTGDGAIDLLDIIMVLDAFRGVEHCSCP